MLIETRSLVKLYRMGDTEVRALDGVSVGIGKGEFVAVMGPSGSGKSTFMNLVGCLDRPTSGEYRLDGKMVSEMDSSQLAAVRNRHIGFVFQNFNLLPRTQALENVELPLLYAGVSKKLRQERAMKMLERVGLAARSHHHPAQLSGGQQQRVAIARALVTEPLIILADEPTGALDSHTSVEIMALFQELNRQGMTVVLVTHEPDVARYARRLLRFRDGHLVADETQRPVAAAVAGMSMLQLFRVALRALAINKLRSALTMLGIVIGVGAVIVMIAVGAGAQRRVEEQIRALGSNCSWSCPAPPRQAACAWASARAPRSPRTT
jgi:putative ABC transport system ATP-binding protein